MSRSTIAATPSLDKCYQLLGICRQASIDELKTAYRALARKWHPDLNPHDPQAHQRFITLSQAYQVLLDRFAKPAGAPHASASTQPQPVPQPAPPTVGEASPKENRSTAPELKWQLFSQLKELLHQQQYLKAIVIIEGLARHAPADRQICQWQGIIYSQFGCQLIDRRDLNKARIYLKKALKADPHNQQLWHQVNQAYERIDRLIQS
jgi:tetratricopeptide (TPR) repeat protein